ncbi:hypothetical protein BY996DRAFT_1704898 [Phakopsora pachyrhizi]|nr:hypothetical protein BY996DRAFT_1704898 [Phakopsora pachyrhizi]
MGATASHVEPLSASRVVFWILVWAISVSHMVITTQLFRDSLPWVFGPKSGLRFEEGGIEDSRRQALPVLIAADFILTILMPFLVCLPLLGILSILDRFIVECLWSILTTLLLLGWSILKKFFFIVNNFNLHFKNKIKIGGSAAIASNPSSPSLPKVLQPELSAELGLSFFLFTIIIIYNLLILFRATFLWGKGFQDIFQSPISSLFHPEVDRKTPRFGSKEKISPFPLDIEYGGQKAQIPPFLRPGKTIPPLSDAFAQVENQARKEAEGSVASHEGSTKTLSSGWDDDDDDDDGDNKTKRKKAEKRKTKSKF